MIKKVENNVPDVTVTETQIISLIADNVTKLTIADPVIMSKTPEKQRRINTSLLDEIFEETFTLESGGLLQLEDY